VDEHETSRNAIGHAIGHPIGHPIGHGGILA
jgi:hypothetical protein